MVPARGVSSDGFGYMYLDLCLQARVDHGRREQGQHHMAHIPKNLIGPELCCRDDFRVPSQQ